ncbi:hypothetical protein OPV22_027594 [Ensete ventricosum]|uniref:Uncharacterized protein n=1 Tax=Ensete ventricosum TaxID=4639 RepID=A0AAV8P5H7_ENSVE|nr:hypothetical protein OPV22_027594 [Ensete ventricosum]
MGWGYQYLETWTVEIARKRVFREVIGRYGKGVPRERYAPKADAGGGLRREEGVMGTGHVGGAGEFRYGLRRGQGVKTREAFAISYHSRIDKLVAFDRRDCVLPPWLKET